MEETYKIVRFVKSGLSITIKTGLSLTDAKEYCTRDEAKGDGWFDGYVKQK